MACRFVITTKIQCNCLFPIIASVDKKPRNRGHTCKKLFSPTVLQPFRVMILNSAS